MVLTLWAFSYNETRKWFYIFCTARILERSFHYATLSKHLPSLHRRMSQNLRGLETVSGADAEGSSETGGIFENARGKLPGDDPAVSRYDEFSPILLISFLRNSFWFRFPDIF